MFSILKLLVVVCGVRQGALLGASLFGYHICIIVFVANVILKI